MMNEDLVRELSVIATALLVAFCLIGICEMLAVVFGAGTGLVYWLSAVCLLLLFSAIFLMTTADMLKK